MKLYRRVMFFIMYQLWPRLTKQTMWKMTIKPVIGNSDATVFVQEKE